MRPITECKFWQWTEGLPYFIGGVRRIIFNLYDGGAQGIAPNGDEAQGSMWAAKPDPDCPLTRGWLLHLVREAWGQPTLTPYYDDEITSQGSWCIDDGDGGCWVGDTEWDVLCAALWAAEEAGR